MNSGQTAERVYDAIKRRITELGFRPGERLDPAHLASELNASVTPVRDALHLLAGARLVETRPSDGFHLPQIDAPALQDLYEWNSQVLVLAARSADPKRRAPCEAYPARQGDAIAALFDRIAGLSSNAEHPQAIASLNDRLRAARLAEAIIGIEDADEFALLANAFAQRETAALRAGLVRYHRRRQRAAADLVRALYRAR